MLFYKLVLVIGITQIIYYSPEIIYYRFVQFCVPFYVQNVN